MPQLQLQPPPPQAQAASKLQVLILIMYEIAMQQFISSNGLSYESWMEPKAPSDCEVSY